MDRRGSRSVRRTWLLTIALLGAVLFGQLGVGPTLLAVWSGERADPCGVACPCEALAQPGSADVPTHSHDDPGDRCPDDQGPSDDCPPDCDDCACCPAHLLAVLPNLGPGPHAMLARQLVVIAPPVAPPSHPLERVFRPPKHLLV